MDWLFTRPTPDEANHWLALLSLAIFTVGTVGAAILATRPGSWPFNGRYTQGFVSKVCGWVGWMSGIGMFFGIIRLLQIDPITLGRGIWILLSWLALIAVSVWLWRQAPADRETRGLNDARLQTRKAAR
ncbi:MAG: hypothetical protein KC435_01615 [Thermomicrobiales bacterium]|nr:hypothetical protein [Thermomicrobiales bacterium]